MEGKRAGGRALGRLQQELRRLDTDSPNLPRTRGLSRVGERDGPLAHGGRTRRLGGHSRRYKLMANTAMLLRLLAVLALSACAEAARAAVRLVAPAASAAQASRVRVSHILVDSEEMAKTVVDSIEGGAAFEEVAESLSACERAVARPAQSLLTPSRTRARAHTPP